MQNPAAFYAHNLYAMVVVIGILLAPVNSSAIDISGTISLPGTDVAPVGGILFQVRASNANGTEFGQSNGNITVGGGSVPFSVSLPDVVGAEWELRFDCNTSQFGTPGACAPYVLSGFYRAGVTGNATHDPAEATLLDGSTNHAGINLEVFSGHTVTGTLSLPGDATAPAGGTVALINLLESEGMAAYGIDVTIAEGNDSVPFTMEMPMEADWNFRLFYDCNESTHPDGCDGYLDLAYYNGSVAGTTVGTFDDAELIPATGDLAGANLSLLQGRTIRGTVSLPSGTAPVGGTDVVVEARDASGSNDQTSERVTIPVSQSTVAYELIVPDNDDADWRITSSCGDDTTPLACEGYIGPGYYDGDAPGQTSFHIGDAELLAGDASHEDIDMTLIAGHVISGVLSLSGGYAPEGGLVFSMRASNTGNSDFYLDGVEIDEGHSSTTFSIPVPLGGSAWTLSFDCNEIQSDCDDFADMGWYNSAEPGNTTNDPLHAEALPAGSNHTGLSLTVTNHAAEECLPLKAGSALLLVCL